MKAKVQKVIKKLPVYESKIIGKKIQTIISLYLSSNRTFGVHI